MQLEHFCKQREMSFSEKEKKVWPCFVCLRGSEAFTNNLGSNLNMHQNCLFWLWVMYFSCISLRECKIFLKKVLDLEGERYFIYLLGACTTKKWLNYFFSILHNFSSFRAKEKKNETRIKSVEKIRFKQLRIN